jgi:tetratricopeptide (TPR) repeat protein
MAVMKRCVDDLRAAHPAVPSSSTFFFSGVPAFAAVQVGDGPLVRGVYRDTTLRSYFASAFRRGLLGRGEVFVLSWNDETRQLEDHTNEPDLWFTLGVGWLLNDNPGTAVEAFELDLARDPQRASSRFGLAIARAALGDSAAARAELLRIGFGLARDAGAVGDGARRALLAGDSLAARRLGEAASARAAWDPVPHLVLSRVYAADPARSASAILEAAAVVAFAPGYAGGWRNWSAVQQQFRHYPEALASLDRYFALDPTAEREDLEAVDWRDRLREMQPGGVRAQQSLRNDLPARR